MKQILSGIAVAVALSAPALAADMAAKAPVYKPAPIMAPAYTWSGFYVGINGGYGWSDRIQVGHLDDNPQGVKPKGWFFGGQIGYNYQINNFVLGIEADFQGADISESVLDVNFGDTISSKLDWFGTVRGRIGYAFFNPLLVYVTGGLAYGHVTNDMSGPALAGSPYHYSGTPTGYTVGGGLEYKINPAWSVKAEYQYINLGTNDLVNPAGNTFTSVLGNEILRDNDYHTVRIGVNYAFGAPPVVARY